MSLPLSSCLSFTSYRDWCYHRSFLSAGLCPTILHLQADQSTICCWTPRNPNPETRPSILLLHGFGANATWQWSSYLRPLLHAGFDLYVPDLLFFGGSSTSRSDRSETFQAECVMAAMEAIGVNRIRAVVGVSYGGFVGYRIAAMFEAMVEKVVLISAGVCLEEKDVKEGMFVVDDPEEAVSILLPQNPERLRQLIRLSHCRPPPALPACFLSDFIHVMCTDYVDEKRELIFALIRDRKLSDLPKISQPTLIIWGEKDQIFPLELGYRLKKHLGENSQLEVIQNAGHAVNLEKPKELCKLLKAFLLDSSKQEYRKQKATKWYYATKYAGEGVKKFAVHLPLLSGQRGKA
ncbi:monoacylglycerol lipase abhd6-A [Phalaenopsis equestris]|uniref:monoacylglycerol lipase abhd6-A n=1 Tax=Phalaenopsis equestris TaxID=78828 RepID=UPI0009E647BE|nr:monoacylglycerol lipase abhd6-A [Phalaenopsis equestris]